MMPSVGEMTASVFSEASFPIEMGFRECLHLEGSEKALGPVTSPVSSDGPLVWRGEWGNPMSMPDGAHSSLIARASCVVNRKESPVARTFGSSVQKCPPCTGEQTQTQTERSPEQAEQPCPANLPPLPSSPLPASWDESRKGANNIPGYLHTP